MTRALVVLLALLVLGALPGVVSQEAPAGTKVESCTNQCTPAQANAPNELPLTGDKGAKIILYAHVTSFGDRAIINAQPLDPREPSFNVGFPNPTLSTRVNKDADLRFENNWFKMASSAGLVEFGPDGQLRTHQEPGLAKTLKFNGDTITLYWYMSAHAVPTASSDSSPGNTIKLGAMPQVGVYARVETGRVPFEGQLLAEGDTGLSDSGSFPTGGGRVTMTSVPGETDVYEFQITLQLAKKEWPDFYADGGGAGFLISVNPYQGKVKSGTGEGSQVMQADWRFRSGPKIPIRLVMDVANPIVTEYSSMSLFNEALYTRWSVVSPFGSYDVDDLTVKAHLVGPTQPNLDKVGLGEPAQVKRNLDHEGHFIPINITYRFQYPKAELADGDYTIHTYVRNMQGSYEQSQAFDFKVKNKVPIDVPIVGQLGGEPGEGPGPGVPAKDSSQLGLLASATALGVAVLMRRRQK